MTFSDRQWYRGRFRAVSVVDSIADLTPRLGDVQARIARGERP